MKLVLALDLKGGLVVHGKGGHREEYRPLSTGIAPVSDPSAFMERVRPRHVYIADLDRICRRGSNEGIIISVASRVATALVDPGISDPGELITAPGITNVVGTETAGGDLGRYPCGYLSLDVRNGRVIPCGDEPAILLRRANAWSFEGCIILNITSVGTAGGLSDRNLAALRSEYAGPLYYGGGVSGPSDLAVLEDAGFDGAIVATAVHSGAIPVEWIRRGSRC